MNFNKDNSMVTKVNTDVSAVNIEDIIGCKYSEINMNEENRINAITAIAAISRGNDKSKNPLNRYKALLKEAGGNENYTSLKFMDDCQMTKKIDKAPGRPLEFLPVVVSISFMPDNLVGLYTKKTFNTLNLNTFLNYVMPFSYIDENKLYTNARALLNAGIKYENIPYNNSGELKDYFITKASAPYFTFAQVRTHGKLSQIAVSARVVGEDEYWLPEDIVNRVYDNIKNEMLPLLQRNDYTKESVLEYLLNLKINEARDYLKSLGYKKEIYNRWPNHMEMKTWMIGGYLNDDKQWGHFLLEREAYPHLYKSWVQKQTKDLTVKIKKIIDSYIG